jgi:hypothetical protein
MPEMIETGTHIPWNSWPINIKTDQDDHWLARVHGWTPDETYKWDQEFINSVSKDGTEYYDMREIRQGDVLRMPNGAERVMWRVDHIDQEECRVTRISEREALEHFDADMDHPEASQAQGDVELRLTGDPEQVEAVLEAMQYLLVEENMSVTAGDTIDLTDSSRVSQYGHIDIE